MARKSRKHKYKEELKFLSSVAVGYIRLSVANKEESSSIENQKFIIECWGEQQQIEDSICTTQVSLICILVQFFRKNLIQPFFFCVSNSYSLF